MPFGRRDSEPSHVSPRARRRRSRGSALGLPSFAWNESTSPLVVDSDAENITAASPPCCDHAPPSLDGRTLAHRGRLPRPAPAGERHAYRVHAPAGVERYGSRVYDPFRRPGEIGRAHGCTPVT